MKTKKLVLGSLFVAITVICAQIIVPLPFTPVQFSFSIIAVFLCGALLDMKTAVMCQAAYILLGAVGAPVFGGFTGGIARILGPTGGYIIAYPLIAFIIALTIQKFGKSYLSLCIGMLISLIACYVLGTSWLAFSASMSFSAALAAGVLPFVFFDVLKIALSAWLAVAMEKRLCLALA